MAWTKNIAEISPGKWSYELLEDGFSRLLQTRLPCSVGDITTEQIANIFADLLLGKVNLGLMLTVTLLEQNQILSDPDGVDPATMAAAAKVADDEERASCAAHFKLPFGA